MSTLETLERVKADPKSTAATLEAVAREIIKLTPSDLVKAQARFVATICAQPLLVAQLFDEATIRREAQKRFASIAKSSPQGEGTAEVVMPNGRALGAAPERISAERPAMGAHSGHAHVANGADPINGGGPGFTATTAIKPLPLSVDPKPFAAPAPARPQSIADIRAAGLAAKQIARTVFDSFRVRDGRPIGDVRWGELERLRGDNAQEASLLRQLQRHASAEPNALVRDAVKVEVLERMIQRAAEVADAA